MKNALPIYIPEISSTQPLLAKIQDERKDFLDNGKSCNTLSYSLC